MKRILLLVFMSLTVAFGAMAQGRTVSGIITSAEDGSGIPGVNVVLKGSAIGTTSDLDGNYKITVPEDGGVLVFSFVGLEAQEVTVGARSVIDVGMKSDVQQLTEVVVTALGISKEKRALGYAVQQVDGEEVAKSRETNVVNALQGQIAGVQIAGSAGGAIGGSSRITIRGVNSLTGNNQPLFVVDGVPMNNQNYSSTSQATGFGTGAGEYDMGNNISDINPADIASVNVLKGAAASALYGVRGANGVILITTKSGKGKKGIGVSVNSAVTFDKVANLIPHQQTYGGGAIAVTPSGFTEFTQDNVKYLAPQYSKDGSWGPIYNPDVLVRHWDSWDPDNPETYKETRPWVAPANDYDEFFETGVTFTNSVALEGGNDKGSFRLSYTNLDQEGVIPNSELGRNTFAVNSSYNLTEKLKATASANFVKQTASGRSVTGYNNANPMQAFTQWWQTNLDVKRLQNYKKIDGSQYAWNPKGIIEKEKEPGVFGSFDATPNFFDNPYFVRNEYYQEDVRDRLFGFFELSYKLTDFLTVAGKAMRDGSTQRFYQGIPQGGIEQSTVSEVTRTFDERNLDFRFLFDKDFGAISVSAILGANSMHDVRTYNSVSTTGGIAIDRFYSLSNSLGNLLYDNDGSQRYRFPHVEQKIQSIYSNATVGYKNILFADLSFRNDWASTLPSEESPFNYWSATTSFSFSELAIFESSVLSYGKLRVGYGKAANAPLAYSLSTTYAPVNPNFGTATRYEVPDRLNNMNLGPEETTEFEVGIETMFFNDRVSLDVTYYNRESVDQIIAVALSRATGVSSKYKNLGVMTNSGFEITLNAVALEVADFQWSVGANFATYNNKVKELENTINFGSTWAAELRAEEGKPYMALYGADFVRDDNGNIIVDEGGMPTATPQRQYLGSAIADFTGGFKNTFSWKGLSLNALFDFQKGGIVHSTSLQWAQYSGMTKNTVYQDGVDIRQEGYLVPGVTEEGTPNTTRVDAQTYFQTYWNVASPNVYKADFLKLRELSLTYNVPAKVLVNTPFQSVSFGVFGRNLAILYSDLPHLDPQMTTSAGNVQGLENAQVPSTRSMGFNLGFKF